MSFLKDKKVLVNLLIMTYYWTTVSFCYYLIQFQLKYFPGDIYLNSAIFSGCTIVGSFISPFIYTCLGIRLSFFNLFLVQTVSGLLIVFWGLDAKQEWVFPMLVLFASFACAASFNLVYAVHGHVFPTLFAATAIGICNFAARIATIFAPEVAET